MKTAVVITTGVNNSLILCFLILWEDVSVLLSHLSSLPSCLSLPFPAEYAWLIQNFKNKKDNAHNVFVFTRRLWCGIANFHILILFDRGAERLIDLLRVAHLLIGRARRQTKCPNKCYSLPHIPCPSSHHTWPWHVQWASVWGRFSFPRCGLGANTLH